MTPEVYTQLVEDAYKALHRHHLHDALYLIDIILKDLQLSQALDDCQQLQDNYARMLQFISSGGKDSNSLSLMEQMMQKALLLLTQAQHAYRILYTDDLYAKICKQQAEANQSLTLLIPAFLETDVCTKQREGLLDDIFHAIWTRPHLLPNEVQLLEQLLSETTVTELGTLISAIGLSLQEYPDEEKLRLLISHLSHKSLDVKVRALTGIIFTALIHEDSLHLFGNTVAGLQTLLAEDARLQELMQLLNLAYLICLQTESAQEKMQNDILPGFMKVAKDGRVELGFSEDGEINVNIPTGKQIDTDEKKKMRHSMKEFFDMQNDGIDLNANNMLTTRSLPFFQQLPHWFLPFDKLRTEITDIVDKHDGKNHLASYLVGMMGQSECPPDRYSTLFIMSKYMGKGTLDKMVDLHLKDENGEEHLPDIKGIERYLASDKPTVCRMYKRQLYRIFLMSPISKEWNHLFKLSSNWLQNSILYPALANNREALNQLATFLAKYNNYAHAEAYLNRLVELEGCDAKTLRSAAHCKQQQGHFGPALTLYTQADILEPNHSWTLAQMQLCYAHLDRHEQRLDCLLQLEALEPNNTKVITETGLCLMQLQRWQDASQRFYRLELEGRQVIPSQRAIAWCSLQQGKTEQALRYYTKLIKSSAARWQDYLNAGHSAWLMGDTQQAVTLYKGYIQRYLTDDPRITDSLTPFNNDNQLLLTLGKTQHEIDLMHDILEK